MTAFADFIQASQKALGMTDTEFARFLRVSRSTIGRWRTGQSAPHPIGQPAIIQAIELLMQSKYDENGELRVQS